MPENDKDALNSKMHSNQCWWDYSVGCLQFSALLFWIVHLWQVDPWWEECRDETLCRSMPFRLPSYQKIHIDVGFRQASFFFLFLLSLLNLGLNCFQSLEARVLSYCFQVNPVSIRFKALLFLFLAHDDCLNLLTHQYFLAFASNSSRLLKFL